jgi:ABC-type transport system involved in multi-copper enzyme maturation permease subunit
MTASSAPAVPATGAPRRPFRAVRAFFTGIGAVGIKELRGRMRGRRAFVVVTVYLLLLSAFAFGIYAYLRQQAAIQAESMFRDGSIGTSQLALSADIGHAIFSGLLLVLTLLVLVLAPAFTTGAISMEREKQTMDLLVTTPLSTLGMVVGKLLSALTYVFLLILASVPVMAVVFVFGGVGPEDLLRAYAVLFATAFGMGAIGLFISAITRRTQTATVITLIVVLGLTLGSAAVHEFWAVLTTQTAKTQAGFIPVKRSDRAPEAILWLNPFVADMDLICTTAPGGYDRDTCGYVAAVTGTPFFASRAQEDCPEGAECGFIRFGDGRDGVVVKGDIGVRVNVLVAADDPAVAAAPVPVGVREPAVAEDVAPEQQQPLPTFGFPRDTFWPQSVLSFVGLGLVLTLVSAQLVAPTRRLRLWRRRAPDGLAWGTVAGIGSSDAGPADAGRPALDPPSPHEVQP